MTDKDSQRNEERPMSQDEHEAVQDALIASSELAHDIQSSDGGVESRHAAEQPTSVGSLNVERPVYEADVAGVAPGPSEATSSTARSGREVKDIIIAILEQPSFRTWGPREIAEHFPKHLYKHGYCLVSLSTPASVQEALEKAHGQFCLIAATNRWTHNNLQGWQESPGALREFAEEAAKEIDAALRAHGGGNE